MPFPAIIDNIDNIIFMFENNQKGVSLVTILVFVIVFGLLIGGGFLLLNEERAKTRDAKRLADMARIQAGFEFLYNDTASYTLAAQNGCSQKNSLVSQCNLKQYLSSIVQFRDPGKYEYSVSQVPSEESYEITFYLEKSYNDLKAGKHTLSPAGIR
jgi:hypothetical protein